MRITLPALNSPSRALVGALLALPLLTPAAHARTYTIDQCASPTTGAHVVVDANFTGAYGGAIEDRCAAVGGYVLTVANNQLAPWGTDGQRVGITFTLPAWMPNARIVAVDETISIASKVNEEGELVLGYGDYRVSGDAGEWGEFIGIPPRAWPGVFKQRWQRSGPASRTVATSLYCYAPCNFAPGGTLFLNAATVTIDDPALPAITLPPSTSIAPVQPRAVKTFEFSASDVDSGIRRIEVRDSAGNVLGASTDGAGCVANRPAPCPNGYDRLPVSVDLTKLQPGLHQLHAVAVDWAGNERSLALPAISFPNGDGGDAATGRLVPTKQRTKATIDYRSTVRMDGKLVDAGGKPISNAQLTTWTTLSNGTRTKVGELTTGAGGQYSWSMKPGSNRLAEITYDPSIGTTNGRSTHQLALSVRAGVTIKLTRSRIPARGTVEARGQVQVEGGIPKDGVFVEVRARSGKRWLAGGVVRTSSKGNYRWQHRFGINRGSYQLQARVLRDSDLAAVPGTSKLVRVTIGR